MTADMVLDLGQDTMYLITILAAATLLPALAVGLVISILQAATSINEMTLTFIPKLAAVAIVLVLLGPWMLEMIMEFTKEIIVSIPELIGTRV